MLEEPHKDELINELRFPNSTNLHTHGLHISSKVSQLIKYLNKYLNIVAFTEKERQSNGLNKYFVL